MGERWKYSYSLSRLLVVVILVRVVWVGWC